MSAFGLVVTDNSALNPTFASGLVRVAKGLKGEAKSGDGGLPSGVKKRTSPSPLASSILINIPYFQIAFPGSQV